MILQYIEELLFYGQSEFHLTKEGQSYCRNQILEWLQVEPDLSVRPHGEKINVILDYIIRYALEEGLIEEDYVEKFADKLMNLIMPSQDDVSKTFYALLKEGKRDDARTYFFNIATASRAVDIYVSRSIGWQKKWNEYPYIIVIPEYDEYLSENNIYPYCPFCVENVGFMGLPGEKPQYTKRVIPLGLGGDCWYFSYNAEEMFGEESTIAYGHHMQVAENNLIRSALDFCELFPVYFSIVSLKQTDHSAFKGAKKVFPFFNRASAVLFSDENVTFSKVDWIFPTLEISGSDKDKLLRYAHQIAHHWNACEEGNDTKIYIQIKKNLPSISLVFTKGEATNPYMKEVSPLLYLGVLLFPALLKQDIFALIGELTLPKIDFAQIAQDERMGKYFDMLMQIAAKTGLNMTEKDARTEILSFITESTADTIAKATLREGFNFENIVREGLKI